LADGAAVIAAQPMAGQNMQYPPTLSPAPVPVTQPEAVATGGPIVGSLPTKAAPLAPVTASIVPDLSGAAQQVVHEAPDDGQSLHPEMFSQNTKAVWQSQRSSKTSTIIGLIAAGLFVFAVFAYWMSIGSPTKLEDIPLVNTLSGN
jgi:hypothetical protein